MHQLFFGRPYLYHVTIRLNNQQDISTFIDKLNKHYQRSKGKSKPLYFWVREQDDNDKGDIHYHIAIIIDERVNWPRSLKYFLVKNTGKGKTVCYNNPALPDYR
jgi:catechol-2,3-dioxygenase